MVGGRRYRRDLSDNNIAIVPPEIGQLVSLFELCVSSARRGSLARFRSRAEETL